MKKRRIIIGGLLLMLTMNVYNSSSFEVKAAKEINTNTTKKIEDTSVENKADFSTDVIYQIVTDRFVDGDKSNNPTGDIFDKSNNRKYHGGDWAGITQKIEDGYFTNMGISALWISSPVENIMTIDPSNQSASYHGYWGKDFFRTNQAFGTFNDFKKLVQTAHSKNIKIVIDFAPNHTSTAELKGVTFPEDGALYRDGKLVGKFSNDKEGLFNHESWTDYSSLENGIYHSMYGLADLNHMNQKVDTYMKDAINKWLDLGVDGIRVDAVKHMQQGWQTNWLSSIYEKHNVFVFGEWFNGGTQNDAEMTNFANSSGMSLLDFRYANAIRNTIGNKSSSMKQLYQVMADTEADYSEVKDQVTFIDNHDMSRFMSYSKNNAEAVNQAYVALLTSRGVPTIYYGSEQYMKGESDPDNRADMNSFNRNSKAYQIIGKLAKLRKKNSALAYGNSKERWVNDDVIVFERKFGNSVVMTAINRNENRSYDINGLFTDLPKGKYNDELGGILKGKPIEVNEKGEVKGLTLGGGECSVWSYEDNTSNNDGLDSKGTDNRASSKNSLSSNGIDNKVSNNGTVNIGNVGPYVGIPGNKITVVGKGFGKNSGNVYVGKENAKIVDWSDSCINIQVPNIEGGEYDVTVKKSTGELAKYKSFRVLSSKQVATRFFVNNAQTQYGYSVYLVGNVEELGKWNVNKAVGPFFNNTGSIATYPTWFYDISLPAGKKIEYKYIMKDSAGNVIWESGMNHEYTPVKQGTGVVVNDWQR
ncbi:alpha-amylase family glycosyl hydrolase [Lachnobacterium bovis]|uniref:Alpha amylase, C-terminal all-beta domain n=1 Tax=Lachnobacterium bovis TaxID=140626 RepID=A0A1H9PBR8_9FIRM|nr:alpha-amylase family glycosyl hydrolase [Lachnobacterium bovis]SER45607.1 Alpha amylase, C-terminal all-beta domain [Lachnobacterium bovis]